MNRLPLLLLIFISFVAFSQEEEFQIQGRIIDSKLNPVADVYILNYRNLDKAVSRGNGVFDLWVLPNDSLMISHISYNSRKVKVFDLMVNPIIRIDIDTVNIMEVDIFSNPQNDYENARKNIETMNFSLNPSINERFTEKEMVQDMLDRENKVMKSEANTLNLTSLSPLKLIGIISKKIERRKKSNQFSSTKKKPKKNYPGVTE